MVEKLKPKAAIEMYDQEGASIATATYSLKQVNQVIIQTSSEAVEEEKSSSKAYVDSSLNHSFRKSQISAN